MVSMQCDNEYPKEASSNPYGYGLTLHLNDDQCEALGIKAPLRAGAKVTIKAMAYVSNVTESVEDDGDDAGNDVSLCLQITDMELNPTGKQVDGAALYAGSDSE